MKRKCIFIFLLWVVCASVVYSQVNVEPYRVGQLTNGLFNKMSIDYSSMSGNFESKDWYINYRSDYKKDDFSAFLVLNFRNQLYFDQVLFNESFYHLRLVKSITPIISGEFFLQQEFNEFLFIKQRDLVGAGIRFPYISIPASDFVLYLGLGFMQEFEQPFGDNAVPVRRLRSTNYFAYQWGHLKTLESIGTMYFQFDVRDINNIRVLWEHTLGFSVTNSFSFNTTFLYQYRSHPLFNLKSSDSSVRSGLSYFF